jgi:3-oxoacyl-[acyl-carrier protein] reductase
MHLGLSGKRALVTGSSRGIGEGVVRALAEHGAAVAVHGSRHPESAERIAEEIRAGGGRAIVVVGDVSDPSECRRVVDTAAHELGGLDVLVNNAGGHVADTSATRFEPGAYNEIMALNLGATLAAIAAAHPHLKRRGGSIINTGSIAGRMGGKIGSLTYAAAKAAVHSVSRTCARELGPDAIRVNTVAPGVILTAFHDTMPAAARDHVAGLTALGRLGTVDDCVGAYLFLASDAMSGYVTGQIIDVNGGWYMS